MKTLNIASIADILYGLKGRAKDEVILFRGQPKDDKLLPKIARRNPKMETSKVEIAMLSELRRRGGLLFDVDFSDDWDLLVYAQHFGMSTRLLDWTTNPLIALYFACINQDLSYDSYVYVFFPDENDLLDRSKNPNPFEIKKTKVLKPTINNIRITSQSGWFTAHSYSVKSNKYVSLNSNVYYSDKLRRFVIPAKSKIGMLTEIDTLGINSASVFPDVEGMCKHINWLFL